MAKTKAAEQAAPGRVLVTVHRDGQVYAPDAVVAFPPDVARGLVADGALDMNPDAVAYCIGMGAQVVQHAPASGAAEPGAE